MRAGLENAGEILRSARIAAGLSLRAAAQRAGTSHATFAAYESGRKEPTLRTLLRLLRACGVDVDIEITPRIRERNGLARGKELEEVLTLAEQFPARVETELPFPRFGVR